MNETEYRSPSCVIGRHGHCADGEPRDSGVPGVRHLVCACPCHPAPEAPEPAAAPPPGAGHWYRLCWTVRPEQDPYRLLSRVLHGVLLGQDVPAILRGMRGCLAPPAFHDPARVRAEADTGRGWRYETAALTIHARRIAEPARPAEPADHTAPFGCPDRRGCRE
ncbi:hypothetical protein [Streptomyces barkulensis]|uniref:hypothetical protein n=1 Tax=Streptomyces barkulensis TaxID=1257026 RepID=UPI0014023738|nr:hypothetical protein [Streptomyces barkulensis]